MQLLLTLAIVAGATAQSTSGRPTYEAWQGQRRAEDEAAEAAYGKKQKMGAVDKVVQMLVDLRSEVMAEGDAEAKSYDQFSCFCKTGQNEKTEAVSRGEADKTTLSASITALSTKREGFDTQISGLETDIETATGEMKSATETNDQEFATYTKNEEDLSGAINALVQAIQVLKASKPSLAQFKSVSQTLRTAALMADALGLGGPSTQKVVSMFLQASDSQAPEVPTENYKFHSASIIETLEGLLKDFRDKKAEVDSEEVTRRHDYDVFMQAKTDEVKATNVELSRARKDKELAIEAIARDSAEHTTVSAVLRDDQQYLKELVDLCSAKAETWDQRTRARADELSALTAAIGILSDRVSNSTSASTIRFVQQGVSVRLAAALAHNEKAMQAIEAEAEDADDDAAAGAAPAPTFLQRRLITRHATNPEEAAKEGSEAVAALLRSQGQQIHSQVLTALASKISDSAQSLAGDDPFAKVKQLIQELIDRLLTEASNEATQKGWCDKSMQEATMKRDSAGQEIASLNGEMAKLEAAADKLNEELKQLDDEIKKLNDSLQEAGTMRAQEKGENARTVQEANEGLTAVTEAITLLDQWYKTNAQNTVALNQQGPLDDAPDAGFEAGEAYTGAQSSAGGIIGMLEVIRSDFTRTISETEKAEAKAEQEYNAFVAETQKTLAAKGEAKKQLGKYYSDTLGKLTEANDSLDTQTTLLAAVIKELLELKPACVDTSMTYADRVARREDEVAALKKALCILDQYAAYGPEGIGGAC